MKYISFLKPLSVLFASALAMVSCYNDYETDYDYTIAYFSTQKPLRTVIEGRNMEIRVGMSIGGRRTVNVNDWATFTIDPTLLDGTSLTLLPENYYRLSDPNTFRVSNPNLAIADVGITFTDAFYADPEAIGTHYALPFRAVESSLDSINRGSYDSGGNELLPAKDYTVVAIKYISRYHGTYYVQGTLEELNDQGETVTTTPYEEKDLSKNITRDLSTVSAQTVLRPGFANQVPDDQKPTGMWLTVSSEAGSDGKYPVTITTPSGYPTVAEASGTYDPTGERPQFALTYKFTQDGKTYRVTETLILRQDPEKDLRFEEW